MSLSKPRSPLISIVLIFSLSLSLNIQIIPQNNPQVLAPTTFVSSHQGFKGNLNWIPFGKIPANRFSFEPTKEEVKEELRQIGRSIVLEESGEERIIPDEMLPADTSPFEGDIFVISDVHLSPREFGGLPEWKYKNLLAFLDKVAEVNGNLVINGDFIEGHMPKTLLHKRLQEVYIKLRKIKRVLYLPGNHDSDFEKLNRKSWKNISFLNSNSIQINGKIIHTEHGHYTDWWWHHIGEKVPWWKWLFVKFGRRVIHTVTWMGEEHNFDITVWWIKWANWFKLLLIVPMFCQLLLMDNYIRRLRAEMGLKETGVPFVRRIFLIGKWIYNVRRLIWELKAAKQNEKTLHILLAHYHYGDKVFMEQFQKILEGSESRVKLHFTAGNWVAFPGLNDLFFTRIQPGGKITKEIVQNFLQGRSDSDFQKALLAEKPRLKMTKLIPLEKSI